MPAPIRVAIIGTGMIGAVHRRAARNAGAHVIGVLASSADKSERVATEWGVPRGYRDLDDLLADRPDVVQICTPNGTHFAMSSAVIAAGINVVCEKPLATDAASAAVLVEAAERAGVVATVPYAYRYHPLVRELRARRIRGDFGRTLLVHGSYLQDWMFNAHSTSWRVDAQAGGASRAFADIGSHWSDLAEFISGERFTAANAATTIAYPTRPDPAGAESFGGARDTANTIEVTTEDTATVTFRTQSGAVANTVISQVSAGRKNRLWVELDGTAGSAVFDQEAPDSVWLGTDAGSTVLHRGEGNVSPDQARFNAVPAGHPQGYLDAFTAFLDDTYAAVRGEERDGLPTFRDGWRSAALIEAVLASAADGTWTDIITDPTPTEGARA